MFRYRAWFMLLLAIVSEVTGTSIMKSFSLQGNMAGYIYMALFIGFSYFSLSKAVISIPISTAYAIWEGLGLIGTVFVAWIIFDENITSEKFIAFILILTGLIMIKSGTSYNRGEKYE